MQRGFGGAPGGQRPAGMNPLQGNHQGGRQGNQQGGGQGNVGVQQGNQQGNRQGGQRPVTIPGPQPGSFFGGGLNLNRQRQETKLKRPFGAGQYDTSAFMAG